MPVLNPNAPFQASILPLQNSFASSRLLCNSHLQFVKTRVIIIGGLEVNTILISNNTAVCNKAGVVARVSATAWYHCETGQIKAQL